MLAAKHFDPVVGIDIHMIQPPGPVPPVPIPHPFVGFLIDPMDYVPIVGSTVLVNGMHRAQAGTAGKCVPPHIPIGGVFVPPPPGNECEMFMGSATVECDGDAMSYMSLPALSCQSIGMPTIPRLNPKKKTKPKCLMLPTSFVLPIPAGPPVMVGGPPTISISGMAMKAGMAALGKLAKAFRKMQKGSKRWKALSDRIHAAAQKAMNKLGIPPSVQNKVHRGICSVTGHPVDIATGKVFTEAVDIQLPGPLPFKWERVWFSTSVYDGPLGHGWHHNFDLALLREEDAVVVRLPDGRPVTFPRLKRGTSHFDRMERVTLSRDEEGVYRLTEISGISYHFGQVTFDSPIQRLLQVTNRPGFAIQLRYDARGHLEEITDSGGRHLPVRCDDAGRILQIRGPHPDKAGQTISLVSYDYSEAGDMIAVRDALDQPMKFKYRDHLLVKETDRNGLSFRFEYEQFGDQIRCVHTWGDGGIYDHRLKYDLELRRTEVSDSLNHMSVHYWNETGLVESVLDPLGSRRLTQFDDRCLPVLYVNEVGDRTELTYDERGNLLQRVAPGGVVTATTYSGLDMPLAVTDPNGNLWTWEYNEAGQVLRQQDPEGLQSVFEYEGGRLVRFTEAPGMVWTLAWDAHGNQTQIASSDGQVTRWQYDFLGRPVRMLTSRNLEVRRTFDLCGRVVAEAEAVGDVRTWHYDNAGNCTFAKSVDSEVRFTYTGLGRIKTRREGGRTTTFEYDLEQRLIGIRNAAGEINSFERDERGEVVCERTFSGCVKQMTRDPAGRLVRIERSSGHYSLLTYDSSARLSRVDHSDGDFEEFHYLKDGQLQFAANSSTRVEFGRDAAGRVVCERQGSHWVRSSYSESGLRSSIRTSLGAAINVSRSEAGFISSLCVATTADPQGVLWQTRIARDPFGCEVERDLPGGVVAAWTYDPEGLPTERLVAGGRLGERRVRYVWSPGGRLHQVTDWHGREVRYEYDEEGALVRAEQPGRGVQYRTRDSAGNVYKTVDTRDRSYAQGGRMVTAQGRHGLAKYEYDSDGRLIRVIRADGKSQEYRWNVAGTLKEVVNPDGLCVSFQYDPLGRRVSKTCGRVTTHWIWDRSNVVHEWTERPSPQTNEGLDAGELASGEVAEQSARSSTVSEPNAVTWVFDPDSCELLARITDREQFSVISDHLGTPVAMTDSSGQMTWTSTLDLFGVREESSGDAGRCPFRWPGQYEDVETGLYYNRFRYYDPEAGQYLSEDPLGVQGGLELYAYVPDPLTWIDPFGLTRRVFENAPYHGTKDNAVKSKAPGNGQAALDNSVQIKDTSPRRVGIDPTNNEIVILDRTRTLPNGDEVFHGHVRSWDQLDSVQQNALKKSGAVDKRGRVIGKCG
jgi:RHS repeat-associated protein